MKTKLRWALVVIFCIAFIMSGLFVGGIYLGKEYMHSNGYKNVEYRNFQFYYFNGYDNYIVFFYRATSCGVFETNGKKMSHAGITFWSPCDVSRPIIIEAIYGVKSVPADEK